MTHTETTIHRVADGTGNIAWVQDCYGRAVFYHTGVYTTLNVPLPWVQSYQELDRVSQVVPATPSTTSPTLPDRYVLGYQLVSDRENREQIAFLHTISVPSPKADGSLATSFINYDPNTDFVSSLVDANGNNRSYQSLEVHTRVDPTRLSPGRVDKFVSVFVPYCLKFALPANLRYHK